MTKRLSEIGTIVTLDYAERSKIGETVEVITHIGEIILTPDQRRELVREAIRQWCDRCMFFYGAEELEQFLEEQEP